jgi:hypothetical protein
MAELPERYMITTVDNPYDPFKEFKRWYAYDVSHGYHTAALLGRVIATSDNLSEADQIVAQNLAIDEMVEINVTGLYRKVSASGSVLG